MFREVFKLSKKIHKGTKGYFDPTVGNLVNAWGAWSQKIKINGQYKTPRTEDKHYIKVSLTENNILYKENSNIILDFNAIAKGYCIDRIATSWMQKYKKYLIELGGELVAKGENLKKQSSQTVDIDNPKETRTLTSTLNLNNSRIKKRVRYLYSLQ